jgi:hypothetical protein
MATRETITQFDLNAEIERFPPVVPSGRRSETLIKTSSQRVVLITMRAGTELREHVAPGTLISVEGGVRHAVRALEDGAFLLTIGWSGEDAPGDES